jgi:hypothetical protein
MSRNADVTDYCSITLETVDRDATDKTPLEQYERKGYALGDGPDAKALDAAVALTASSWGPPFATPYDKATGEWYVIAYNCACHAVERAIVDALVGT